MFAGLDRLTKESSTQNGRMEPRELFLLRFLRRLRFTVSP